MTGPGGPEDRGPAPVAVIGGGFSGTAVALQLLARAPDRVVHLFERGPAFAKGLAYATTDPVHLLNVRAAGMSAWPDRPDDFRAWFDDQDEDSRREVRDTPAGRFVPRAQYGRYLGSLLREAVAVAPDRLRLVPDQVTEIRSVGGGLEIDLGGGGRLPVAGAILAMGNLGPPRSEAAAGPIVGNPWTVDFAAGLAPDRPVAVIGTGLTTIDVVMSLKAAGLRARVIAISRRGLVPHSHVLASPWPVEVGGEDGSARLLPLMRQVRREAHAALAAGRPWQDVIDGLRPHTVRLWRGLSLADQARFLRHLRPWWDVHRHRTAPSVGDAIAELRARGELVVAAGRVLSVKAEEGGAVLTWRPRGETEHRVERVQRVIVATGAASLTGSGDPLVRSLLAADLVRADPHGLGIETTAEMQAIGRDGRPVEGLWALGPLVRGMFWECTAVPDIRADAARLAEIVADSLAREGGRA